MSPVVADEQQLGRRPCCGECCCLAHPGKHGRGAGSRSPEGRNEQAGDSPRNNLRHPIWLQHPLADDSRPLIVRLNGLAPLTFPYNAGATGDASVKIAAARRALQVTTN